MPRSKSYRVLKISDIHMSNKLPQAQLVADGATDRLGDQLALWTRVHQTAIDAKVSRILVLGDLFDKSLVDAVTLTATVEAITSSPVPVDILPGNHDAVSTQGGRFTVEAFGKMGHSRVSYIGGDSGPLLFEDWLRLWPIEYSSSARALARIDVARASMDVHRFKSEGLLLHHSIVGCKHLGWTCDDGLDAMEVTAGFDHVYSGHFHEHQTFGVDDRGMYLGAPMHHRMDDEGRAAGYWVVEYTPDGHKIDTFVDGMAPLMWTAPWKGSAAKTIHRASPGDYLRINVDATHAEWTAIRPAILEFVERLKGEGIKATHKHRPVYHHTERMATPSDLGGKVKVDAMIPAYVDSAGVETSGLDVSLLRRIGLQALEEARRRT